MNLRVKRKDEYPINPPIPPINEVNKDRVTATIIRSHKPTLDGVKVFKDDLKGLPTNQMRFIEVYEENENKYHMVKAEDITSIEYSKDGWEN